MKYIFCLIVVLFLSGCKSKTIYVPVESVKTGFIDRHRLDSVFVHDSVMIRASADTFWIEKYKTIYRDRLRVDSVIRNDTIRIPYPVIETREVNRLRSWQIILMCLGSLLIGYYGYRASNFFR